MPGVNIYNILWVSTFTDPKNPQIIMEIHGNPSKLSYIWIVWSPQTRCCEHQARVGLCKNKCPYSRRGVFFNPSSNKYVLTSTVILLERQTISRRLGGQTSCEWVYRLPQWKSIHFLVGGWVPTDQNGVPKFWCENLCCKNRWFQVAPMNLFASE